MIRLFLCSVVSIAFVFNSLQLSYAQDFSVNQLPLPGTMVGMSAPFVPLALKGLIVDPHQPLEFQFLVDTGKGPRDTASIKDQAGELVKYFLAGLTIPEGDLWVNLSPYEKDRIIPAALGQTDLGRDLLAEDYILKQLTASLIYPEKDLGKAFWSRVYAQAQKQFGTTNVPVNTFNKVWILPDQVQVYQHGHAVYITKATLKVMMDEDYMSLKQHAAVSASAVAAGSSNRLHSLGSQMVREIILPAIAKEVNEGRNFAPLRQIYQAIILAKWYKQSIQNRLLEVLYNDKSKIAGINVSNPAVKEQIYQRYLQAYKKGVFNYIKETPVPEGQAIPRKYFSGGVIISLPEKIPANGSSDNIRRSIDGAMLGLIFKLAAERGDPKFKLLTASRFVSHRMIGLMYAWGIHNSQIIDFLEDRKLTHNEMKVSQYFILHDFNTILKLPSPVLLKYIKFFVALAKNTEYPDVSDLAKGALGMIVYQGRLKASTIPEDIRFEVLSSQTKQVKDMILANARKVKDDFVDIFKPTLGFKEMDDPYYSRLLMTKLGQTLTDTELAEFLFNLAYEVFLYKGPDENIKNLIRKRLSELPKEEYLVQAAKRALSVERNVPTALMESVPAYSVVYVDAATMAENPGGIDFNQINIHLKGNKIDMAFDPAQLSAFLQGGFTGFSSVVLKISPVADPLSLLGVSPLQ